MRARLDSAPWWEEVKRSAVLAEVATGLGMQRRGHRWGPCVACNANAAGRSDRRPPISMRHDGSSWRCWKCNAGGSVLDLVSYTLNGGKWNAGASEVREWFESHGFCNGSMVERPRVRTNPPRRATREELDSLWGTCVPVGDSQKAAAMLRSRDIDPGHIEDTDSARVLPVNLKLPAWAKGPGGMWNETGHRLLVRTWNAAGQFAGVRARYIGSGKPRKGGKSLPPRLGPGSAKGLVMACPLGQAVLAHAALPSWCESAEPLRALVVEGETDWWSIGEKYIGDQSHTAVFGVVSGAWTEAIAGRLPPDSVVLTWTDDDETGLRYARAIGETLGHCRWFDRNDRTVEVRNGA